MVQVINMVIRVIDQFTRPLARADAGLKRFALSAKMVDRATGAVTTQMRGFRMEMLSVMFFGMAMASIFRGFIDEVLKNLGVFDMLTAVMEELLYPVLIPISDILYALMEIFMDLPEPIKAVFGALMIGVTVGGIIIMSIGMLTLAAAGLGLTFGSVLAPILLIVGAIAAAILVFSWLEQETGIVSRVIEGMGDIFSAVWGIMSSAAALGWDIIKGVFIAIMEFIAGFLSGLLGVELDWQDVWTALVKTFKWFWGQIGPIFKAVGEALEWIRDMIAPVLQGLGGIARGVGETLGGIGRGISGALGFGDFIFRPGSPPVAFDKNDTVVGFKGGTENMFSNQVTINAEIDSSFDVITLGDKISDILLDKQRGFVGPTG